MFLSLAVFSLECMPKLKVLNLWSGNAQDQLLFRLVPLLSNKGDQQVLIAWSSTWLGSDDLVNSFSQLRQRCLKASWQLTVWREDKMKPAEDKTPGLVDGYHRLPWRMKRKMRE